MTRYAPIIETDHNIDRLEAEQIVHAFRSGKPIVLGPGYHYAGTYQPRPRIRLANVERWLTA